MIYQTNRLKEFCKRIIFICIVFGIIMDMLYVIGYFHHNKTVFDLFWDDIFQLNLSMTLILWSLYQFFTLKSELEKNKTFIMVLLSTYLFVKPFLVYLRYH